MKIKVSQLEPNPFRDMAHYPIDENKVNSLVNSINELGFWNNISVRSHPSKKDKFQIAYGHHRLLALTKAKGPDFVVELSVEPHDDETMLRIMAEENNDYYTTDTRVINETVKQVYEYLKKQKKLIFSVRKGATGSVKVSIFEDLPSPTEEEREELKTSILAIQVSKWMGSNWNPWKIADSIKMIESIEEGVLDKEASEVLPFTAARKFATLVRKCAKQKRPLSTKQQRTAAKQIKESENASDSGVQAAIVDQLQPRKTVPKKDETVREFRHAIKQTSSSCEKFSINLLDMIKYKDALKDQVYEKETKELAIKLQVLFQRLKEFIGGKNEHKQLSA